MLLADSHITMVVGVDIHVTTAPPFNPVHPYIGMVMDPADYIPFLGTNVSVNGLKRGVSDTGGMIIPLMHIPLAGPFAMASVIGHESMNFFASQTVFCDGTRMSPKGYMVMTCNDVGIPLSAGFGKGKAGKTKLTPSLFAPTSFSLPIPTGKPVMVGGPYAPDWGGMLTGLVTSMGFSSLMKLGRKGLGKALKTFNHKVLKNADIQKRFPSTKKLSEYLCKNGFEPVNLVNGAVVYEGTDFGFPSPLPLEWTRAWYSDSGYEGWLGHGVHCRYDRMVQSFENEGVTMLRMEDGRAVAFPPIAPGGEFYMRSERTTLRHTDKGYVAYNHDNLLTYRFDLRERDAWRLTRIENPDGLHIQLRFTNGRLSELTDPAGRRVHATTDSGGRVTKLSFVTDKGFEPLVSYTYDGAGNMTGITDATGNTTKMSYSGHLMTEKTDRNGNTYCWEYDGKGRCIHTYGRDGMMEGRIEYHPDKGYNLVTDSEGGTTTYRYTPEQLVTAEIDPLGNETRHSYTDYMEPYRTIDPEGGVTGYSYDSEGKLTGIAYPDGSSEMYVYNERGRLIIHIDREGNKSVRLYDPERPHLVSGFIDETGGLTEFTYDSHGLPLTVSKGKRRSELSYDEALNLVSWHEDGRKLGGWRHDAKGRLTERSSPGSRTEFYHYDALDRLRRIDARDGNVIHLDYDSYDSITEARDDRRHVRMGYNSVGSMVWREEAGNRVSFRYDGMDRLREVVNEAGIGYAFRRDLAGNITSERDFGGMERKYHRDGCGRVTRIDRPGDRSTAYTYDTAGRMVTAEYHDGTKEEYGYDRNGLMISADNGEARILFERDPMGRVTREVMGLPGSDTFTEVMSVESEYNGYGERTRVRSSLGADTELSYDRSGLVGGVRATVEKSEVGEAYGDTAEGEDYLSWESTIGRDDAGRVSKRVGNGTRRFGWDGNVVLHEWDVDEAGKPKIVTDATGREEYSGTEKPENLVTWVYDGTSFTPVAKVADGERYTIVQDYLGTPTQAYDSRGELVWEMLLDMYGKVTECYGDRTLVPFRYQGQYEDSETGLYYNRYRYYSPDMGIYISSDPIGLAGGFNTYAYVKDTNTWVDVLGLSGELVYQLIRDNKVVYYGITSRTALERMAEHGKTKVFDNMEILADGLTHDQARSIEGALIRQRLKERADDWSDFDSIKARLDKSGLDNRNRGRIKEHWTSENPLDDLRDKIYKKPKKVKVGCKS